MVPRRFAPALNQCLSCIDPYETLPFVVLTVVICATLVPLLFLPALPFWDLPNHLARLHAIGASPHSAIRQAYMPHWALMPNLGCDLIFYLVQGFLSPDMTLRICVFASLLTITLAICRIQWALFRTLGYAAAASPLLIMGLSVYMGYVNYILSVAIVFAALACYLGWEQQLDVRRIALLCAAATAAWFAHIAGYMVFGLLLGLLHLSARLRDVPIAAWRKQLSRACRTAVVMFLVFSPGFVLSLVEERQIAEQSFSFAEKLKLRFLMAPCLLTNSLQDLIILVCIASCCLILARRRLLYVSLSVRPALIVFGILVLVCPWRIGEAIDVDSRLVMPFVALALAATRLTLPQRLMPHALALGLLACLLVIRWQTLSEASREAAHEISAFRALDRALPMSSAMMVAIDPNENATCEKARNRLMPPLAALGSFASIDRGIYVRDIFTSQGMQPLRNRHAPFPPSARAVLPPSIALLTALTLTKGAVQAREFPATFGVEVTKELREKLRDDNTSYLELWPDHYEALLVVGNGCLHNPIPGLLRLIGSGDFFELFQIIPKVQK
jgi:hypothetical protein